MKKILSISLIIVLILLFVLPSNVLALGGDIDLGNLDNYVSDSAQSANFDKTVNGIIYVIQVIGSIVSVAVLVILGIKYMMGSVEERAQYKKTLMPYFIGAILFFGISNVTSLLYNIIRDIF